MTTPPTTFDTFDYAAANPRTDEERMALLDAMLDELRETEARMDARAIERQRLRHETQRLQQQTQYIIAHLKEDMWQNYGENYFRGH